MEATFLASYLKTLKRFNRTFNKTKQVEILESLRKDPLYLAYLAKCT